MAVLMSMVALSIDAMLPALGLIAADLGATADNESSTIVSTIFYGVGLGLMFYGPFSDSYGRKKAVVIGILIFLIGNVLSYFAVNMEVMLIGRLLQGFGAASCRTIPISMIRDNFSGAEMGRIMSLILSFFILVPALAPILGQAVLVFADWRAIFSVTFSIGLIALIWFQTRMPETLKLENRLKFSMPVILSGIKETLSDPAALVYMISAGITSGAFIGYLASVQPILQIQYELGDLFPLYFGALALAIGSSFFANSKMVMKFAIEKICATALGAMTILTLGFVLYCYAYNGHPPLLVFMITLGLIFFCFGLLFGNFNVLAVEKLGHIAGVATSVIASVQNLISAMVGSFIALMYDGTVMPLTIGFAACGLLTFLILYLFRYRQIYTIRSFIGQQN